MTPFCIIVGLGNPGPEYVRTRHNIGFRVLDALAVEHGVRFVEIAKYHAELAELTLDDGRNVTLVKPATFMNRSGDAVGSLARFYKLPPAQVWVVQDDIDLELGRIRLKPEGGGHGGHNGIKSLEAALGSTAFPRLKLGVSPAADDPRANAEAHDLVLGGFSAHEEEFVVPHVLVGAVTALQRMLRDGPVKAASIMGIA